MELALSTKRKLGYVTGVVTKSKDDAVKEEAWTVSNNLVISWILQNVSERIKLVIMYTQTAKEIWDMLQRRYTVANGARKFKLNKDSYGVSQAYRPIEEYYTQLQIVWDELENMNNYPPLTQITTEMRAYLDVVHKQAEERRLFQFLNGLDKEYGTLRSNILLMDPLPCVDTAVAIMLQEETQSNNLKSDEVHEMTALMSKGESEKPCRHCGRTNHKSEKCWEVCGYPMGHPKNRKPNFNSGVKGSGNCRTMNTGSNYHGNNKQYNNYGNVKGYKRSAANAKAEELDLTAAIGAATQKLDDLLRLVPGNSNTRRVKATGDSDEELECKFAGP